MHLRKKILKTESQEDKRKKKIGIRLFCQGIKDSFPYVFGFDLPKCSFLTKHLSVHSTKNRDWHVMHNKYMFMQWLIKKVLTMKPVYFI